MSINDIFRIIICVAVGTVSGHFLGIGFYDDRAGKPTVLTVGVSNTGCNNKNRRAGEQDERDM